MSPQDEQMRVLTSVDREVWLQEAANIPPFYQRFGDRLPAALWGEFDALMAERLKRQSTP